MTCDITEKFLYHSSTSMYIYYDDCMGMYITYYTLLVHFIQVPPPINDVTLSTFTTPSDLSGFDIFIMWTVSEFYTYVLLC